MSKVNAIGSDDKKIDKKPTLLDYKQAAVKTYKSFRQTLADNSAFYGYFGTGQETSGTART